VTASRRATVSTGSGGTSALASASGIWQCASGRHCTGSHSGSGRPAPRPDGQSRAPPAAPAGRPPLAHWQWPAATAPLPLVVALTGTGTATGQPGPAGSDTGPAGSVPVPLSHRHRHLATTSTVLAVPALTATTTENNMYDKNSTLTRRRRVNTAVSHYWQSPRLHCLCQWQSVDSVPLSTGSQALLHWQ
jgi:hypothetical protein